MSSLPEGVSKKSVYTLMLINFINLMGFGLVLLLLPFFAMNYGAGVWHVALIGMTYSLCQFIFAPVLGVWSDRVGRRPVLIFSQLGSVVGYLILAGAMLLPASQSGLALFLIYLSRVIDGCSAGNITITNAYVADVIPAKDRAGILGLLGAAFGLGFAFGPPLGGILHYLHPTLPGLVAASFCLVASVMTIRYLPESHTSSQRTAHTGWAFSRQRLHVFAQQPVAVLITVVGFLSMIAYVMIESSIPLLLKQAFNYNEKQAGYFFGIVGLIIIFVQGGLVRPLNKRLGEWPLAFVGTCLATVGLLLYAHVAHEMTALLLVLAVAAVFNAVGRSLQTPTLSAMLSQNTDPNAQGAAYGVFQGAGSLARVLGPLFVGLLYSRHPAVMFLVAALFTAVAAGILLIIRPRLVSWKTVEPGGFPVQPNPEQAEQR
jgi:MFS transporter, DHA1 family, tetracycline resistance protein